VIEQDTELYELPKGWVWTSLKDVCLDPQYGWTTSADSNGTLKLLRTTDITAGHIDWHQVPFCKDEPASRQKYLLSDGDIVISRAGSVGYSSLINEPPECVFASYLIRFKPLIDNKYLLYFTKNPSYWDSISEKSLGIAIPNVNASKLKQIIIPLPPLPEQQRIVAKIEELFTKLDAGTETMKKIRLQIKSYRQSVLKSAFEGKLTAEWRESHKGELEPASELLERIKAERKKVGKYKELPPLDSTELPELPEEWVWTRVGEIGQVISGNTPKNVDEYNCCGEIPYFRISDMNTEGNEKYMVNCKVKLSQSGIDKLKLHPQNIGTVIFPKRGGAISTNKKRILAKLSTYDLNTMGISPVIIEHMLLYYWMLSIDLTTLSDGSNVPQINHSDIEPLAFPLPPLPEQQKIIEEIERHFSIADKIETTIEQSLKQAERLRQSILKRAFEGKLVPQDPSDEPAEKLLERIKAEKAQNQTQLKRRRTSNGK